MSKNTYLTPYLTPVIGQILPTPVSTLSFRSSLPATYTPILERKHRQRGDRHA